MKTKAKPKVLLLGICAGWHRDFDAWCRTGVLPTLQGLLQRGLSGPTRSVPVLYVQCTWPAFYTGTAPGKMGVHSWTQLKPGTYELYRAYTPHHVRTPPFWDILSAAGKRVAILDVPHSGPSAKINGVQLVEWGAHDANLGFVTSPPELAAEVIARFGQHPQRGLCDADRSADELAAFRDGLLAGIEGKVAITRHFLAQEDWDLAVQVFTETHCIGHQAWHLHDPEHPRYDAAEHARIGDPFRDVHVAVDRAIGRILADVDERTTVIVMAGHGMMPKYAAQFMLGDILLRLGVAAEARPPGAGPTAVAAKRILERPLAWAWRHTPAAARTWLDPLRRETRELVRTPSPNALPRLDPAAGRCFIIPNNHTHGGVRVNLVGREPAGKVRPGGEFDTFLDELSRDLLAIVNVDTGRRIVNRVIRRTELYQGDGVEHFPDLFVEWTGAEPVRAVHSPKIGRLDKEYAYCRTGEHVPVGTFIATGPGIAPGRLAEPVSVLDFAPTLCAALGVAHDGFDGTPIAAVADAVRQGLAAEVSA